MSRKTIALLLFTGVDVSCPGVNEDGARFPKTFSAPDNPET